MSKGELNLKYNCVLVFIHPMTSVSEHESWLGGAKHQ